MLFRPRYLALGSSLLTALSLLGGCQQEDPAPRGSYGLEGVDPSDDATIVEVAGCGWSYPVGTQPSSSSPLSNHHDVGGNNLPHFGPHLGADYWIGSQCDSLGQPVYAAASGTVVEIRDNVGNWLDYVILRHNDPVVGVVYTAYGHLDRDLGLQEGQVVSGRQQIGTIGDVTNWFDPCHLHFEILSSQAYEQGPHCCGGSNMSRGYAVELPIEHNSNANGDTWLDLIDGVTGNRWYHPTPFINNRLGNSCGADEGWDWAECNQESCDVFMAHNTTGGRTFLASVPRNTRMGVFVEDGDTLVVSYPMDDRGRRVQMIDRSQWRRAFGSHGPPPSEDLRASNRYCAQSTCAVQYTRNLDSDAEVLGTVECGTQMGVFVNAGSWAVVSYPMEDRGRAVQVVPRFTGEWSTSPPGC